MLNRFRLWEWIGCIIHLDFRAAGQGGAASKRTFTIGGVSVQHSVYFPEQTYRRYFANHFRLVRTYSLGALRPPHTVRRIPKPLVAALEWLDVRTGHWPLVKNGGRFFVLDLERLPTPGIGRRAQGRHRQLE